MTPPTVLIADDDRSIRTVLTQALGRSGRLFAGISPTANHNDPHSDNSLGTGAGTANDTGIDNAFNASSPLPEMSRHDEMLADFRGTGVSAGPHPLTFVRERLRAHGIVTAAELGGIPHGRRARVAGIVIVRQRPGTAKGFVFLTVEDETGFANAIITPQRFETHRQKILGLGAMVIEGKVQNQDGVVSIKADGFLPLPGPTPTAIDAMTAIDISHDFY